MADKRPETRKNLPGGFFLFLIAAVFLILTLQNMSSDKAAKVAFSHQVEHLVNLDLIQKENNQKVALNDNLVTFSGKFRDKISDESKARYHFLELLNKQHDLEGEETRLTEDMELSRQNVKDAADWFLHLSGLPIPEGGYRVVDPIYDSTNQSNAIIIKTLSDKSVVSLKDLEKKFSDLNASNSQEFGKNLYTLIQGFRSSTLGIGSEAMKQQLKTLELEVAQAIGNPSAQTVYKNALSQLDKIVNELDSSVDHIRLLSLRSVRNYKGEMEQYQAVRDAIDGNGAQLESARQAVANVIWFFNNKELSSRSLEKEDPEAYRHWYAQAKEEWDNFAINKGAVFKAPDQPRNTVLERTFKSEKPAPNYFSSFLAILPIVVVIGMVLLLYFVFSRQMKGVGNNAMNFGKSPARLLSKDRNKVTFKDVAGCDEAKEELEEIVDFLKDPAKFTALGARIPKGVLCIGPPGTGKTLIAKAVAGEADRPFFSISGSDFVEMFVGVGASRIRDLFDQAKKQAPCIIFIDEIDAVGRHRGAGIGGGHDEREQTLNQLLVEMDGFDTNEGVILIAATNRPDVLDKALLRPGRFDRRIVLDLPDVKGRYEILKVHARRIKLDPSVDLMSIAKMTPGASGADLENILNEAALLAARRGRSAVTGIDAAEASDKVRYGKERRSLEVDQEEKKTTAYHESGHAIVALFVKHSDPVDKVTIIPRGMSLGATHFMPEKNRLSYWKREILDKLAVLMGGRVAEEVFVGDISSGAKMDFNQATQLARSMVCEWGMTEALGTVSYDEMGEGSGYLGVSGSHEKNYSEATAQAIDIEVRKVLDAAYLKAKTIVTENKDKLELMTQMLMEFETLDKQDVQEIIKGEWDIEKKRKRLKSAEEAYRKLPPPPPIVATPKKGFATDPNPTTQGI